MNEPNVKETKKKENSPKQRIGYGVKLPSITFEEAIGIVKTVASTGGVRGHKDALSHVTGNTPTSSTLHYKIAALKNFGLLITQDDGYELTTLGERIAQPQSSEDVDQAIFESFLKLDIIKDTWENYRGKLLPQREYLANFIEKNLEIPQSLKLEWADYFIEAAKFARLLREREAGSGSFQVLNQPLASTLKVAAVDEVKVREVVLSDLNTTAQEPAKRPMGGYDVLQQSLDGQSWGTMTQRKVSGGRRAIFAIPDDLTQEDIEMLRGILKGIDATLDGLKKHETEN